MKRKRVLLEVLIEDNGKVVSVDSYFTTDAKKLIPDDAKREELAKYVAETFVRYDVPQALEEIGRKYIAARGSKVDTVKRYGPAAKAASHVKTRLEHLQSASAEEIAHLLMTVDDVCEWCCAAFCPYWTESMDECPFAAEDSEAACEAACVRWLNAVPDGSKK